MATYGRDEGGEYTIDSSGEKHYYRPGTPEPAAPTGGNNMATTDQMRSELQQAGYPGPWDDASVASAYNRTVNGGNAGGGGSGGTGLIGGDPGLMSSIAGQQAATALAAARLEFDKARMEAIEKPTMENQRKYQESVIRLQDAQDTWNRDWTERKYGMDRGDQRQQFAVNQATTEWDKRIQLANQNAQNTGIYVAPDESPNLPYSYRDDEFRRDFLSRYGRQPTDGERYWNMPEFASPSAPNPVSQAPQVSQADQAQMAQVRQMAERDLGRGMSEPEWQTYLTGRFSADHPLVLQGKYKSGQLLSDYERDLGRPLKINQYLSQMPESIKANYGRQTGTTVGDFGPLNPTQNTQMAQVRSQVEGQLKRPISDAEWRTYVSGRFDPEHELVKSGQYQAGQPLADFEKARGKPLEINRFLTGLPRVPGSAYEPGQPSDYAREYAEYLARRGDGPAQVPQIQDTPSSGPGSSAGPPGMGSDPNLFYNMGVPSATGARGTATSPGSITAMGGQESNMQPWQEGLLGQQGNRQTQNAYQGGQYRDATLNRQYDPRRFQQQGGYGQGGQMPSYGGSNYGGGYNPNDYVTADPISGKQGTISIADRNNYYNQTGNTVTGQQGLLGRQQNMSEQQQRWLQEYQRGQALGRINGQDTLGGRAQGLEETKADRDWQYKQAQTAANPANAAMMEALGGRGALRTQGLLGQGGQGGRTQAADPRTVNPYSLDRLSPDQRQVMGSYARAGGRTPEDYEYEANRSRPQGQYAGRARWR